MSNSSEIERLFSEAEALNQKTMDAFQGGNRAEFEKSIQDAIDLFNAILILSPDNAEAHYWLGNKFYELSSYPTSLSHFDKSIEIAESRENKNEHYIDALINRAGTLCELKRYDEAIDGCDLVQQRFQDHPDFKSIQESCTWIKNNCRKRMME